MRESLFSTELRAFPTDLAARQMLKIALFGHNPSPIIIFARSGSAMSSVRNGTRTSKKRVGPITVLAELSRSVSVFQAGSRL